MDHETVEPDDKRGGVEEAHDIQFAGDQANLNR